MDQLLVAYQENMIGMNMIHGANNLEENTKVTQLEHGLATVFMVALILMNLNGNGVIAKIVIGTMIPWTIIKLEMTT